MEERLRALEEQIRSLTRRIEHLETALPDPVRSPRRDADPVPQSDTAPLREERIRTVALGNRIIPLLGRTCLELCGAFLLRALTEADVLPPLVGVSLGLFYGAVLLGFAWKVGARGGDWISAEFHAVTALVIALPILVETTLRFGLLNAPGAAGLLGLVTVTTLVLLWRIHLPVTGWILSIGATSTAVVLARGTGAVDWFAAFLVLLGLATLRLAETGPYRGTRWFPALSADVWILLGAFITTTPGGPRAPYETVSQTFMLVAAIVLLTGYLGAAALKLLHRGEAVGGFFVLQTAAAVLVGLTGSARMLTGTPGGVFLIGTFGTACGLAFYGLAFSSIERRHGRKNRFFFATGTGLLLATLGSVTAFGGTGSAAAWAVLGIIASLLGGRYDRITLRVHAAVFLVLATVTSGLGAATIDAFFSAGPEAWRPFRLMAGFVLVSLFVTYGLLVLSPSAWEKRWTARLPRFVLAAFTGTSLLAVCLRVIARVLSEGPVSAGALAAFRTSLIAAAALGLGVLGQSGRVRELSWLVYPLLLVAALRLIAFDLRVGSGITLFPTFAVLGLVLLLTPRLMRKRRAEPEETAD